MSGDRPDSRRRPSAVQYVAYCYGKVLPKSMREWVIRDLGGPRANLRTATRLCLPILIVIAVVWAIPIGAGMQGIISAVLFLPFMYFSIVLNESWRRHRLQVHGLDPELADWWLREKEYAVRAEYEDRFGH